MRSAGVLRQAVAGEVDLHHRRGDLDVLDVLRVLIRQVLLSHQLEIGPLRVGVGEDDAGVELLAVLGHRAGGAPALDADVVDLLAGADIDAEPLRHPLQRLGEAPHRPPQIGPLAALAGGHPHGVVELDVTRAGVARTAEGADQPQGGGGRPA